MFIETEITPNPETLKFLPGRTLLDTGSADFPSAEAAQASPLAEAMFALTGVARVFLGHDFVSVTKTPDIEWDALKPNVLAGLMQFFASGADVMAEGVSASETVVDENEEDADIIEQIKILLEEKVRPAVAGDGGDIVFRGFKEGVVYLEMQGACSGCPSSTMTLQHGIANLLKHYVPEVVDVRPVEA
ncbi:MAG: NifU family protein [Kordiimonadaceae bacterium]|nr:NifU family protein [Kordiimonadaceae bacterium]